MRIKLLFQISLSVNQTALLAPLDKQILTNAQDALIVLNHKLDQVGKAPFPFTDFGVYVSYVGPDKKSAILDIDGRDCLIYFDVSNQKMTRIRGKELKRVDLCSYYLWTDKQCIIISWLFILLVSFFFVQTVYGNVMFAERWDLSDSGTRSVCSSIKTLYFVADSHRKLNSNRNQLKELLHFIRVKKGKTSLIAEDRHSFDDCKLDWQELNKHIARSNLPLQNIVSLARHCGMVAISVECRPRALINSSLISISDVINATNEQVKKISEYDDGFILNEEYKQYVHRYNNKVVPVVADLFNNIAVQNCSLKNINYDLLAYPADTDDIFTIYKPTCNLESCDLQQRVREVITCYAQEVIDFKILHALAEHAKQGVEVAVVYAGGYHINAIKPVLEKLGYRFSKYPTINYGEDGNIQPLNVAQAFQEMDPTYDPNEQLPKETIDYFFEYKEAEEENPCFRTRSTMKMFVAAADALCNYRLWKKGYPRLDTLVKTAFSIGVASVVLCVLKVCCKSK